MAFERQIDIFLSNIIGRGLGMTFTSVSVVSEYMDSEIGRVCATNEACILISKYYFGMKR